MAEAQVRIPIPSLIGGISHQPPHLRYPNQVEDAQNVLFSPIEGASKRPPTRHLTTVTGLTTKGSYRLHMVVRDQDERYLVIYGEGGALEVWEIKDDETLVKATLTADSDATTYLQSDGTDDSTGDPPTADHIKLVTLADRTMIVNTKVAAKTTDSDSYEVAKTYRNREEMLSDTPAALDYARVGEGDKFEYFQYTPPSSSTWAVVLGKLVTGGRARSNGGVWADTDKQPVKFRVDFQRFAVITNGMDWNHGTKTLTADSGTPFANYTFRKGDQVNVTSGTNVIDGWYTIESKTTTAIVLEKSIKADDDDEAATDVDINGIGRSLNIQHEFLTQEDSMHDIASILQNEEMITGDENALISWRPRPDKGGGRFLITSPYRGADATVTVLPNTTDSGTDLTQANQHFGDSFATAGTGSPPTDTLPPIERWTQVPPPAQIGGMPDKTTMPAVLTRTIAPGPAAATFTLKLQTWNARVTGDNDTNPAPTLITAAGDHKITDMAFHRDRFWLGGDERLVASQAGDYFNFYMEDHENIVSSDPIDIGIGGSGEKVSFIDYLVPFRNTLVIWTKTGDQFEIEDNDILTPETIHIHKTTSVKTLSVRPVELGPFLYFMASKKDSAAMHEYFFDDRKTSDDSFDVSAHVNGLLPTSVKTITVSSNDGHVFVLPNSLGCNELFVYVGFWRDNKREVSSWSRWIFDSSYKLRDIAVDRNDLYLLVESSSPQSHWFERMSIDRQILERQTL